MFIGPCAFIDLSEAMLVARLLLDRQVGFGSPL